MRPLTGLMHSKSAHVVMHAASATNGLPAKLLCFTRTAHKDLQIPYQVSYMSVAHLF